MGPSKAPSANPPHPLLPLPLAIIAPTNPRKIHINVTQSSKDSFLIQKPEPFLLFNRNCKILKFCLLKNTNNPR